MTAPDLFEQRALSAGAALRAAFLEEDPMSTTAPDAPRTAPPVAVEALPVAGRGRRARGPLAAAAALVVAALAAGAVVWSAPSDDPADVLQPLAERETAQLSPPFLVGSGPLPDRPVQSVQDVPVPFTFRTPPQDPDVRPWQYYLGEGYFDLGNILSGITVIAPTQTYDPTTPWQGQDALVAAPTDAEGWADWLDATGHVEITDREQSLVGGAVATRFALDLGDLPAAYEGCGGGRTCLALMPMADPSVGPARVGEGPQAGIDEQTPELTVIELEDRAVLVLTTARPDTTDDWLPTLRALVASLRFA